MRRALVAVALIAGCSGGPSPSLTLVTLNIASGAADVYRTPEARARQAALLDASGAQLAALEEVDVDVERSGRIDTARAVARIDCGIRRCAAGAGAVVFAMAFRGDDPFASIGGEPIGIIDGDPSITPTGSDRRPEAMYGNALVARGIVIVEAYAVGLPTDTAQPADDPLFSALAAGDVVDATARETLGARNLALRNAPAIEPRVALVARVARDGTRPLSVITTHLESAGSLALRLHQLARVIAVAGAERDGPPMRDVVVLGDFNLSPSEAAAPLEAAGFVRAVGSHVDQIWVDARLAILAADEPSTENASDHETFGRATIR